MGHHDSGSTQRRRGTWQGFHLSLRNGQRTTVFAVVFVALILACYVGILARMSHHLSSLWLANAVLAGVMLRYPLLNRPMGWVAAFVAFMVADLSTGGTLWVTFGLTIANMSGALAMVAIAQRWPRQRHRLREPRDVVALGGVCIAGATAATIAGVPCGMVAFDSSFGNSARSWFAGELTLYLAILPVILAAPPLPTRRRQPRRGLALALRHHAPVLALPAAIVVGIWIGGSMALMTILPLLLWSALRGEVFQTAVLALLTTGWNLVALGSNITEVESFGTASELSVKVGLAVLAAGPLAVAAAVASREEALRQVHHLAQHDTLTGLLNRGAFLDAADRMVHRAAGNGGTATVFMVDLDHFKCVNDRFGHPTGDALLAAVGSALTREVRSDALIGRVGGEEFAVAIAGLSAEDATSLGERLRRAIATATSSPAPPAQTVPPDTLARRELLSVLHDFPISASIGVATRLVTDTDTVSGLLTDADHQLYEAKRAGRDQVRAAPEHEAI